MLIIIMKRMTNRNSSIDFIANGCKLHITSKRIDFKILSYHQNRLKVKFLSKD